MTELPGGSTDPSDEDLGDPITELSELRDPVPEGFLDRIRGSIHRRSLAGDLTRFTLWGPAAVFLELLSSLFEWLGGSASTPAEDENEDDQ